MNRRFVVGLDLGQAADPTAICVLEAKDERVQEPKPHTRTKMAVRHLERLPLRMGYPQQVAHVTGLLRRPPLSPPSLGHLRASLQEHFRPEATSLVIDATGVGRPVVQMFEAARLNPVAVTITAGDSETRDPNYPGWWRVSKLLLVSRLQAALHAGDLLVDEELPEAATLVRELHDFRASFSETGAARFGAREGAHDDLVLALAIAAWHAERAVRMRPVVQTLRI